MQQSRAGTCNLQDCQGGPEAQHTGQLHGLWALWPSALMQIIHMVMVVICKHSPLLQVCNGSRVFAAAETPKANPRVVPKKSQKGRWRGMDEDVSDDQVQCCFSWFSEALLPVWPASHLLQLSTPSTVLDWMLGSPGLGPSRSFPRQAMLSLQQAAVI